MKKTTIGYLFNERNLCKDEITFLKLAKQKNINLVMINTSKVIEEEFLEKQIKECDIFFNNSAENFSLEIAKTIEILGKKVIDSPDKFYLTEDKWLFFVKCKQQNISTPKTILLSENINTAIRELKEMNEWPVILKRVEGTCGIYVEKADNISQAEEIIQKFWTKGNEKLPIIAQELILSPSYRITIIGDKIVQTAIKSSKTWKATGVHAMNIKRFKVDKDLKEMIKKLLETCGLKVCGIDLLKKDDKWLFLEINSQPAFDFFEEEREGIIGKVLNFLKKEAKLK